VCSCEVPAANHRRGDSFGGQCRYEPSPNSLTMYPESQTQKVEMRAVPPDMAWDNDGLEGWKC